MSDFLDLPTLIIIGVAIFVLFRLRSVLGTRTGTERPPSERIQPKNDTKGNADETVVPLRPRDNQPTPNDLDAERRQRKLEAEIEQFSHGDADLGEGLKAVAMADADFTPKSFMGGAKSAYEMVITAYAQGDRRTLKNLLEKDVYDGFEAAISEREANGHSVDFTFVGLPKVEITTASVEKRYAQLSLRFNAEIVSATRDKNGDLVDGNADQVVTIVDEWTFGRNTKSRDPNWKLVATDRLD